MNWIQITKLLLSALLLLRFWKRFFNQLFANQKAQFLSKSLLLAQSAFLVGIFAALDWLLSFFNFPSLKTALSRSNSAFSFGYFSVLLLLLPCIFWLTKKKKIWLQLTIGLLMLFFLIITGNLGFLASGLAYRIIFAAAEELFKFTTAQLQQEKSNSQSISSLLLFTILIAFGFSLVETSLALILNISNSQAINASFLIGRGLIASLIHIIATGSIALILLKNREKNQILVFIVALLCGFLLHTSYNLALHFQQGWIGILLAIGGFFGLSYLFYHLDELYQDDQEK